MPNWVSREPGISRPRNSFSRSPMRPTPISTGATTTADTIQSIDKSSTGLSFLNATAVGFVSPKLIRSPALKTALTTPMMESSTVLPRGDVSRNLFHPDFEGSLSEVSERGLTQWLNSVFAPCTVANSGTLNFSGKITEKMCIPGSTSYCDVVEKALKLRHTVTVIGPGQRLEREVDEGKIVPMSDLSLLSDKGAQQRLLDHLLNTYAPIWLHVAVDTLVNRNSETGSSTAIDSFDPPEPGNYSSVRTSCPLSRKLRVYLFAPPRLHKTTSAVSKTSEKRMVSSKVAASGSVCPSRDLLHNRHAVKRFLILVWFLDRLKSNRLIDYNPCLFRMKSHIKLDSTVAVGYWLFVQFFLLTVWMSSC
ncbi:unnamed protein product [Dicrocoelium dendriticum]|nr:unnamed protein product [Dicrocoelium dendriticum]